MHIDPVQKRAGYFCQVFLDFWRCAFAGFILVGEKAAGAGVTLQSANYLWGPGLKFQTIQIIS